MDVLYTVEFFHALLLQKSTATETQWIAPHHNSMLISLHFTLFKRHIYLMLNGGLALSIISESMMLL